MGKRKRDMFGDIISRSYNESEKNKKEEEKEALDLNEVFQKGLENLTKGKKLKDSADAISKLIFNQGDKNQNNTQNPLKQLKEAGLPLNELFNLNKEQLSDQLNITQKQAESLWDRLQEERKARMETEERRLEEKNESKQQEMNLFSKLLEMQQQREKEKMEYFNNMISDLKEEIKEAKKLDNENKQEDDPIRQASKKLVENSLDEKLNQKQPDPFEAINYYADRIQQIKDIFGPNTEIDTKQLNLKHQLELEKTKLENKRKKEEAQKQRELEREKMDKWEALIQSLQQMVPAVIQTISQKNNQQQPQPQQGTQQNMAYANQMGGFPQAEIAVCEDCGYQLPANDIPDNCPNCNASFVDDVEKTEEEKKAVGE